MPFTFAHPAAVLPLKKFTGDQLSLTGLIIGSIVPDFEYFVRLQINSKCSHTLWGLLLFNLPVGLILCFLLHNTIKHNFIQNSPAFVSNRLATFRNFNWNQYALNKPVVVCISILTGAVSHLLWDSFTHAHGFFVETISTLKTNLYFGSFTIPVYKVLQHGSTCAGLLLLCYTFLRLPLIDQEVHDIAYWYWVIVSLSVLVIAVVNFLILGRVVNPGNCIITLITGSITGMCLPRFIFKRQH